MVKVFHKASVNVAVEKSILYNLNLFADAERMEPDMVLIDLGGNDSKLAHWDEEKFVEGYKNLIAAIREWDIEPDIKMIIPAPINSDEELVGGTKFQPHITNELLPDLIP